METKLVSADTALGGRTFDASSRVPTHLVATATRPRFSAMEHSILLLADSHTATEQALAAIAN